MRELRKRRRVGASRSGSAKRICQYIRGLPCRRAELIEFVIRYHFESNHCRQPFEAGRTPHIIKCSGETHVTLFQHTVESKVAVVRGRVGLAYGRGTFLEYSLAVSIECGPVHRSE